MRLVITLNVNKTMEALSKIKCPECGKIGVHVTDDSNEIEGPLYALMCDHCGRYISDNSWTDSSGPYKEASAILSDNRENSHGAKRS